MLVGCGQPDDKAASQVVARVNSEEITVHEINYLLARIPNVTQENAMHAKRLILGELVDQELARQEAIKDKLDRTPDVLQALEFAKAKVLARSYLRTIAAAQPRPTDAEVKRYYSEHPELFAQRRIFNLDEIVFSADEGLAGQLRTETAKARSLHDIAIWLRGRGIKFTENRAVRVAEQVPLEVLSTLQAMRDGEIKIVQAKEGRYHLVQVVQTKRVPVDEASATPRIREFLFNRRASAAVAANLERLKKRSKIEYFGEFAAGAEAGESEGRGATRSAGESQRSELDKAAGGLFK
jgi:EpsD family peptidyl-prolyl cis-trans isomerase